jgi:hypothetical protein
MADELVNSSFGLLNKFVKSGQESASKTATSHIRESLAARPSGQMSFDKDNHIKEIDKSVRELLTLQDRTKAPAIIQNQFIGTVIDNTVCVDCACQLAGQRK